MILTWFSKKTSAPEFVYREGLECGSCGNVRVVEGRRTKCPICHGYSEDGKSRIAQMIVTLKVRKKPFGGYDIVGKEWGGSSISIS